MIAIIYSLPSFLKFKTEDEDYKDKMFYKEILFY